MDPISEMLNRIRNAQLAGHAQTEIPFSNFKYEIAKILEENNFLEKVEKKGKKVNKTIEVTLKYENKVPVISGLKRISRPGQRIYFNHRKIKKVRGGYGLAFISTPKGLMTDKETRKQKIGGEVLFEIW